MTGSNGLAGVSCHEGYLGEVGVLELINQQVARPALSLAPGCWRQLQQVIVLQAHTSGTLVKPRSAQYHACWQAIARWPG